MINEAMAAIADCLNRAGIPYMVVGGQAVLQYGRLRTTEDIDVTVNVAVNQWSKVVGALRETFQVIPSDPGRFVEQTGVLPALHQKSGIRVDFIFGQTGFEIDAIRRAPEVDIGGVKVKFADPEDLIIQKVFAGRSVDLADAASVYRSQKGNVDDGRIARVLKELDETLGQNVCIQRWNQLQKDIMKFE
jgi:predicted nucleotidyltransferase